MKIVTVVGARPQFIKCAPVSRCLGGSVKEVLLHTGQHYDDNMSRVFFSELGLPEPDYNLNIGSGTHGCQTGNMLAGIEAVLLAERPDLVLVYGDTNSTLAGALAAVKVGVRVAHVEAGLRSFNRTMPEEINRILTDRISSWLFCPTTAATHNLTREGIRSGVYFTGDVMYDALLSNLKRAEQNSRILKVLSLRPREYILATVHRASNTDDATALRNISSALQRLAAAGATIIFPVHPRTRARLKEIGEEQALQRMLIPPTSYLDTLLLQQNARLILTDSGGVQKEAFWLSVPCVTLRQDTEWVHTVEAGWNVLVGSDTDGIISAVEHYLSNPPKRLVTTEDGRAAERICKILCDERGGLEPACVAWEADRAVSGG